MCTALVDCDECTINGQRMHCEKATTCGVNGTARKRKRNKWFFIIWYHKACGKWIGPISNCHSNCAWFACFARIITSLEWTTVSAAIIYLIWISHLCIPHKPAYQKPFWVYNLDWPSKRTTTTTATTTQREKAIFKHGKSLRLFCYSIKWSQPLHASHKLWGVNAILYKRLRRT